MKTVSVIFILAYLVAFIPALRTAIAFWLYKDKDDTAKMAMRHGFLFGLLSIWAIYPIYLIRSCFKN